MAANIYTKDDRCVTCKENSKRVAGFWDGHDDKLGIPIRGQYYDCSNMECPIKMQRMFSKDLDSRVVASNRQKNLKNDIDFDLLEKYRRRNNIFISTMCAVLKITPSEYCAYRSGSQVVPPAVWKRVLKEYDITARAEGKIF